MHAPEKSASEPSRMIVREMVSSDAPAVVSILGESLEASLWSEESLRESAMSGTAWIAEREGSVIGFLIGRAAADEFEILNLAVARSSRRSGVGTRLLETMTAWLRSAEIRRVFLEVRASNEAAIALYARRGFKQCGSRSHYYQHPAEAATVFSLDLSITP